MRIHKVILVFTLVAGLAACSDASTTDGGGDGGGSGGSGGGSSLPDACTLVTEVEVETAIGGTVAEVIVAEPPNHYAFGEGAQCMFVPDEGMVSPTRVTIFHATDESWSTYVAEQTDAFGAEPLAGLGDEAIVDYAQVAARSGGLAVTIDFGMYVPNGPGQRERMATLAQTVVGRLPQT